MSFANRIYVFDNFELDEHAGIVQAKGGQLKLTKTEYSLLRFFVKHPKKQHRYNDLYEEVFGMEGRSKSNTIPQHVSTLNKKLRSYTDKDLITNIQSVGYRFDAEVAFKMKSSEIPIISDETKINTENQISDGDKNIFDEISEPTEDNSNYETLGRKAMITALSGIIISILFLIVGLSSFDYAENSFSKILFIGFAAFCYASLNVIGLILECAYEFDKYRYKAMRMIPTVFLINLGVVISGFVLADDFLQKGYISAFWIGLVFLIIGAIFSCLCGYFVLPNVPIAKASVQTQPAFAAFCKNVLFYFLPLCSIFGLLIFCFLYGKFSLTKNIELPIMLVFLWLVIFGGSMYSTFYFTDKLLAEKDGRKYTYYQLYFSLLMIRAAFFFGPTAAAVIWYLLFVLNYNRS